MKSLSYSHWGLAICGSVVCHMMLTIAWAFPDPPQIEKSAGAPIEIVGSLVSFSQNNQAIEETVEEILKPEQDLAEDVLKPLQEIAEEVPIEAETIQGITPDLVKSEQAAIVPPAAPEKKKKTKKSVEKKKKTTKKVAKKDKRKRKKQVSGKRLAALKKGGGAKGKQSRVAGRAVLSNYRGRVQSHLARYKRAARHGMRGRAIISFKLSRSGRVMTVRLVRSSGNKAIDRASLSMVKRASPFPAIPRGGPTSMRFSVPVRYN